MRTIITCILCLLLASATQGQTIKGRVVDAQTGKPLYKASVYINSSTIGTTTNENGAFTLEKCPSVKFEVVASYIGYQTLMTTVTMPFDGELAIKLTPGAAELKAVVVRNYQKNGWAEWGTYFLDNFLGTSKMARQCRIKNYKDMRFSWSDKKRELYAISVNPLVIVNKALGYTVEYDLESFYSDFKTGVVYYQGYPRFIEMKGSAAHRRRWNENRKKMYEGSALHFFRAVFNKNLDGNGFQVRKLVRQPNLEKQRVRRLYKERGAPLSKDSSNYYSNIMRQPDYFNLLFAKPLPVDSISTALNNDMVTLAFSDYLQVSYLPKKPPEEYYLQHTLLHRDTCLQSEIVLTQAPAIYIVKSGNFYEPSGLLFSGGFWGWSEKVSAMLPLDYEEQ